MSHWFSDTNGRWMMVSKRERLMLFGVGLLAILGLMDTYLTDPVRRQTAVAETEITRYREDTSALMLQIATMKQPGGAQVNSPQQQTIMRLQQQVAAQETMLANLGDRMVSPQEILGVIKQLLMQHRDVYVEQLESVPPVSFVQKHVSEDATMATVSAVEGSAVYQHTLRLKVHGGYMAVMAYVADLKKLGATIAWEHAVLQARYPTVTLSLDLYTLSTDRVWLGI